MWWTNEENRFGGNLSKNIYAAEGFGGNFIVIDSEHDLLIVTRWLDTTKIDELVQLVSKAIEK